MGGLFFHEAIDGSFREIVGLHEVLDEHSFGSLFFEAGEGVFGEFSFAPKGDSPSFGFIDPIKLPFCADFIYAIER